MQKVNVEVESWEDFDVNKFTQHTFYVNRKVNSRNYYRCKEAKKGCKAIIKVKYDIILQNAEMAYLSEHNHPLITPCRVTKETYKDVDSFINNNDGFRVELKSLNLNSLFSLEMARGETFSRDRSRQMSRQVSPSLNYDVCASFK